MQHNPHSLRLIARFDWASQTISNHLNWLTSRVVVTKRFKFQYACHKGPQLSRSLQNECFCMTYSTTYLLCLSWPLFPPEKSLGSHRSRRWYESGWSRLATSSASHGFVLHFANLSWLDPRLSDKTGFRLPKPYLHTLNWLRQLWLL